MDYKTISRCLPMLFLAFAASSYGQKETHGINLTYMDKSVKPGDDFFRYVNGEWLDKTEIPADRSRWGSFDELIKNTDKEVLAILKEAAADKNLNPNSDQAKAVIIYNSYMDTMALEKAGPKPLIPYLQKINAIKNINDLEQVLIDAQKEGGSAGFFSLYVGADDKNSNRNVINLFPSRLGLPDREYYVSDEKDPKEKRQKYVEHVTRMLQLIGETPAQAKMDAEKILAFEISLSKPQLTRVERRDPNLQYNPTSIKDLQKMTSAINWDKFFKAIGFAKLDTVIVSQPKYMAAVQTIFTENKVEDWKTYLKWNLLRGSAGSLSPMIETANWEFYGKTLQGSPAERPREERALQTVNFTVGEALGSLYVAKKFPPEAKAKAEKMISNIILAYQDRINKLPWMSPETKKKAIEKTKTLMIKVGYPNKWEDYSKLVVKSDANGGSLFENMKNVGKWAWAKDIEKMSKPVDKTKWEMTPQTVNAYYNPSYNEIVFPAAILQPPFYDYKADEAVNYGGIGAVIGHEISHGFDDQGAKYNAEGNLIDWWTDQDAKSFATLGTKLADQYSALEPLPGIHVDGKFTLGENIGDLGGVNAAYDGLQLYLKEKGNPGLIDGFTPEQRFFMSWATVWRTKMRDEAIKSRVKTDPHAPGMYRAYMPLVNVEAFYSAFNIKPTNKLYVSPENRVTIW